MMKQRDIQIRFGKSCKNLISQNKLGTYSKRNTVPKENSKTQHIRQRIQESSANPVCNSRTNGNSQFINYCKWYYKSLHTLSFHLNCSISLQKDDCRFRAIEMLWIFKRMEEVHVRYCVQLLSKYRSLFRHLFLNCYTWRRKN